MVSKFHCRPPNANLTRFHVNAMPVVDFFVILLSEAEEETGSAEEQPASNRLLRHTEIVVILKIFGKIWIIESKVLSLHQIQFLYNERY